MERESLRLKALEEDRRFTEYRLQVARELPAGSYRDAVVGGIAARLATLANAGDNRIAAPGPNSTAFRASLWDGRH